MESNPEPIANKLPAVWPLVIDDMHARHGVGIARYGTPLQPFNGRKPLVDAYEEVLDLAVYLRQEIEEQKRGSEVLSMRNEISELHRQLEANIEETSAMSLIFDEGLKQPGAIGPRTEGHGAQRCADKVRAGDAGGIQESAFQRCRRLEAELEKAHHAFKIEQDLRVHQEKAQCEQRERWAKRSKEAFEQRDNAYAKCAALEHTLAFYLKPEA